MVKSGADEVSRGIHTDDATRRQIRQLIWVTNASNASIPNILCWMLLLSQPSQLILALKMH